MPRAAVLTRVATPDDLDVLVELWDELSEVGGRTARTVDPGATAETVERLRAAVTDSSMRVVVAASGDELVGMAVLAVGPIGPLSDARAVHMTAAVVRGGHRRHGVGHALVGAAVAFADDTGCEQVVASAYPALREANRFFARLGFAPYVVRRAAPVASLRRRLATDGGLGVDDVVRRRSLVRRPRTAPAQRAAVQRAQLSSTPHSHGG